MKTILVFLVFAICRNVMCDEVCEEIVAPMCRGLIRYNMTKMPNMFGHKTQKEAYKFMERFWASMDLPCSKNIRQTICGAYFPQCESKRGSVVIKYPCREGCIYGRKECRSLYKKRGLKWPAKLKCKALKKRKSRKCIKPYPKVKVTPDAVIRYCEPNRLDMCHGFNIAKASLPNFFDQENPRKISKEMENYRLLLRSNCSPNLRFFMCGVYQPFCVSNARPVVLPCRELCQEVMDSCKAEYKRLYKGLLWPAKFQCHRYPFSNSTMKPCKINDVITPEDEEPFIWRFN